jgi:thioredoxin-dependent peroxiredoxin
MEAYRDQYATLFKNGRNVVVIAVSVDADTTQAAWAREKEFPVLFASDAAGRVGQLYAAYDAKNTMDNRSLFVIGADGRIAYVVKPFNVLSASAYTDLGSVIDRLTKTAPGGGIP